MSFKHLKPVQLLSVGALVLAVLVFIGTAFSNRLTLPPADKLLVFITVDVETPSRTEQWKPFETPVFITGEGLTDQPGIPLIMSLLEKYRFKGSFFLDVYEEHLYKDPATMKLAAQSIAARGHEVDLHCHTRRFSDKDLVQFSLQEQVQILQKGKRMIEQWTGNTPPAFRAGGYLLNEDTLRALETVGIPIDSSIFYTNPNNKIKPFTKNSTARYGNIIELPVTIARHVKSGHITKFDLDRLGYDDLTEIVKSAKAQNAKKLVFMMHSFSLVKFKRNEAYKPLKADYRKINKLDRFLKFLSEDPQVEVVTYQDWLQRAQAQGEIYDEPEFMPLMH